MVLALIVMVTVPASASLPGLNVTIPTAATSGYNDTATQNGYGYWIYTFQDTPKFYWSYTEGTSAADYCITWSLPWGFGYTIDQVLDSCQVTTNNGTSWSDFPIGMGWPVLGTHYGVGSGSLTWLESVDTVTGAYLNCVDNNPIAGWLGQTTYGTDLTGTVHIRFKYHYQCERHWTDANGQHVLPDQSNYMYRTNTNGGVAYSGTW